MSRPEFEALYGGSAGGGKSDALLMEALRQVDNPDYKGLILRKTYPQLSELIDRSLKLYKLAFPRAKYNASNHIWTFPSGAQIHFGSMQHSKNRLDYQGKAYQYIAFDELTHFTYDEYMYLFSRCRPSDSPKGNKTPRCYIRSSTNPGGIGHSWVMSRFVSAAPPMTTIIEETPITKPDGSVEVKTRDRIFVPATIFDNQILLSKDSTYLASLAMLPEQERQALLYGSWDSFSGQVFTSWKNDPEHYEDRKWTHVIAPFEVPPHFKIIRGFDWGFTHPFSVLWMAVAPNKQKYIIKEFYGCDGTPNKGVQMHHVDVAEKIREIEDTDPNLKGRKITGPADPSIFEESRGLSIASAMARYPNYVVWHKGDNARIPGKMQVHYHLAFNSEGEPLLQVFNTCKHLIRTLPNLVYDEKHTEDVNSDMEDHAYDALRYLLQDDPVAPRRNEEKPVPLFDPLNQFEKPKQVRYYKI
jgi:hypothetical protein